MSLGWTGCQASDAVREAVMWCPLCLDVATPWYLCSSVFITFPIPTTDTREHGDSTSQNALQRPVQPGVGVRVVVSSPVSWSFISGLKTIPFGIRILGFTIL